MKRSRIYMNNGARNVFWIKLHTMRNSVSTVKNTVKIGEDGKETQNLFKY